MSPHRRSANRSATAPPLRHSAFRTRMAVTVGVAPLASQQRSRGRPASAPVARILRVPSALLTGFITGRHTQQPVPPPSQNLLRGPRRARHRQPIGPPSWEVARGVLATNHILALFLTPPLSKAFDCSLVRRKSLKNARKEGPEESGLAGGPRRSASWGRGCSKGRGEVVPHKPSALETWLLF